MGWKCCTSAVMNVFVRFGSVLSVCLLQVSAAIINILEL